MSTEKPYRHWLSTLALCLFMSLAAVPQTWATDHCACECFEGAPGEVCRGGFITTFRVTEACTAALQCEGNGYAVLSYGDVKLPSAQLTGNVHGNGKVDISGSSHITGDVSTSRAGMVKVDKGAQVIGAVNDDGSGAHVIKVSGSSEVTGSATTSAGEVDVLTFDELVEQLNARSMPYTYSSGNLTLKPGMTGIFIVEGDAKFSNFSGNATVIARGNINFGGNSSISAVLQSESRFPGGLALFGRDVSVHGSVSGTIVAAHNLNIAPLR